MHGSQRLGYALLALGLAVVPAAMAAPGDHIVAGTTEIVPDVDLGFEFRTNAYRTESDPTPGMNLRVSPGLRIQGGGPDTTYSLAGDYEIRKYFKRTQTALDRYTDFNLNARVDARKKSLVGFSLSDDAGLDNNPVQSRSSGSYVTRFRNELVPTLVLRPGPALEFSLAGAWEFDDYAAPAGAQLDSTRALNRRHELGPRFAAKWTFFPRTAAVFNAEYNMLRWDENWLSSDSSGMGLPGQDLGDYLAIPDSQEYRFVGGIRGRFTERVVVTAQTGYGRGVYDEQSVLEEAAAEGGGGSELDPVATGFGADVKGAERWLLDFQARYELAPDTYLIAGYERDFESSWFTNYVAYNHVYGTIGMRLGARMATMASMHARVEGYRGEVVRNDISLRAQADVVYYLQNWATVSTGVWWDERASDPDHDEVEYDDFNIHLLTTFTY